MNEFNRNLEPGTNILWDGQVYEILRRTHGSGSQSYIIRDVYTDWHGTFSHEAIANAVYSNRCFLGVSRETPEADTVPDPRNCFDDFPEEVKQGAREKLEYIRAALREGVRRDEHRLAEIAQQVAKDNNFARPMKGSTLRKWIYRYREANYDISALVPANHRKGRRTGRYPADIYKIWSKLADELGSEKSYATPKYIYGEFVRRIKKENEKRQKQGLPELPTPQISFVRERINLEDRYKRACRELGKQRADLIFSPLSGYHEYARVLQYCEADTTYLPIYVRSDTHPEFVSTVRLVAVICAFSRMIIGYRLCWRHNKREVVTCLRHGIQPKNELLFRDGEVADTSDWPAYGVPDFLRVDNGPEFNNHHVKDALSVVGVTYDFAKPYTPSDKPFIERFFGTIKQSLLPNLYGYITDDNFREGTAKNYKLLTFSDLEKIIHRWITEYYHHKWHDGILTTPYEKWCSSARVDPPRIIDNYQQLIPFLAFKTKDRVIDARGVRMQNQFYFNEELVRLRQDPRAPKAVNVHYDKRRPDEVWAHDPVNHRYLKCVPRKAHGDVQRLGCLPALETSVRNVEDSPTHKADEETLTEIIADSDACATKPRKAKKNAASRKKSDTTKGPDASGSKTAVQPKNSHKQDPSEGEGSDEDDEPLMLPAEEVRRT